MLCYDFRITPLCNGSTSGFGPLSPGSNPGGVAIYSFPLPDGFPGFVFRISSMIIRQGDLPGPGDAHEPVSGCFQAEGHPEEAISSSMLRETGPSRRMRQ